MENEIKKLIEKHTHRFLDMCDLHGTASRAAENENIMIKDLQSLLEFKQKNCCEKPNVIVDNRENELVISLTRINDRADFRRKIEDLFIKYMRV